jgi:hypothetical protein
MQDLARRALASIKMTCYNVAAGHAPVCHIPTQRMGLGMPVGISLIRSDNGDLDGTNDVPRLMGGPREQGRIHGRSARTMIAHNITQAKQWMEEAAAQGRRYDNRAILQCNERFVEFSAPDVLEEIRGIAEGAALPYEDVLGLNVPLFIVATYLPMDCTQILLRPPATSNGETYLVKTRDLRGHLEHVVLHRIYPDGREMVEVTVAGSVTWPGSGLNGDGVAYSTSGVWSTRTPLDIDRAASGWILVNTHLLLRHSRSLEEFIAHLRAQPRVCPLNLVACDSTTAEALEVTAKSVHRANDTTGFMVRTNHYLTPEIIHLGPTCDEHPSSHQRYATALRRLQDRAGTWTLERVVALLGDHEGYPQNSICRHAEDGRGADTAYASIAVLPVGMLWVTRGHPCRASAGRMINASVHASST